MNNPLAILLLIALFIGVADSVWSSQWTAPWPVYAKAGTTIVLLASCFFLWKITEPGPQPYPWISVRERVTQNGQVIGVVPTLTVREYPVRSGRENIVSTASLFNVQATVSKITLVSQRGIYGCVVAARAFQEFNNGNDARFNLVRLNSDVTVLNIERVVARNGVWRGYILIRKEGNGITTESFLASLGGSDQSISVREYSANGFTTTEDVKFDDLTPSFLGSIGFPVRDTVTCEEVETRCPSVRERSLFNAVCRD